jgi:hypothetical protein
MRPRIPELAGLLAAAVSALAFAASAQSTFYEAYEAGLRAESAGRWQEARAEFREAARLRGQPGRSIKTYGLNFLDTYDPYLHLARAALRLDLLSEAESELARGWCSGAGRFRAFHPRGRWPTR